MKYRLVYTEHAAKDISKLDSRVKRRIGDALERYADAPLNYARKMADPLSARTDSGPETTE